MNDSREERKAKWDAIKQQGIVNATVRVITREGFQGLTMAKVAQEAGVAKATLYLYFNDKNDLLDSVWRAGVAPIMDEVESILTSDLSPPRILQLITLRHLNYFEENKDFFRFVHSERLKYHGECDRYQDMEYQRLVDQVAHVIERGIRTGCFKEVNTRKFATMFIESNIALINFRILSGDQSPFEEDGHLFTDIFLYGIAREAKTG